MGMGGNGNSPHGNPMGMGISQKLGNGVGGNVKLTLHYITTTPHLTFSGWRLCRYTRSYVRHEPSGLLRQSPDWRSEEDDRQVATCPQLGSTNRLEHAQVRPGTHSFPAKSATLAAWTLSTGFGSEFASRCSDVCTRWLLNICLHTANPSPAFLAVAICDRLTVVILISHVWNLLPTEDVHLHTPALRIGTHFLLTLETVDFLFHLLTTSKPFSSLSTVG